MTRGENHIVVFIPDFSINTQGNDIPGAIETARDAVMGIDMQDDGETLPAASSKAVESARLLFIYIMCIHHSRTM